VIRALARVFDIVRVLSSDRSPIFGVEMIMVNEGEGEREKERGVEKLGGGV
jgi:hypothetical protein